MPVKSVLRWPHWVPWVELLPIVAPDRAVETWTGLVIVAWRQQEQGTLQDSANFVTHTRKGSRAAHAGAAVPGTSTVDFSQYEAMRTIRQLATRASQRLDFRRLPIRWSQLVNSSRQGLRGRWDNTSQGRRVTWNLSRHVSFGNPRYPPLLTRSRWFRRNGQCSVNLKPSHQWDLVLAFPIDDAKL